MGLTMAVKRRRKMNNLAKILIAVAVPPFMISMVLTTSAFAHLPGRDAPGPIVGAGLPVLAVGYGAYWLIRRYRRKKV
jgi:lipopolysaccharide export LptBFGC system permease protein LptF